ncbi:hypothetical protein [Rhizobium sp.]|uniref:hypothetical protein n=1 Tax=Rhizobium sp. TaxID=391 RepID=UPI000DE11B65
MQQQKDRELERSRLQADMAASLSGRQLVDGNSLAVKADCVAMAEMSAWPMSEAANAAKHKHDVLEQD